ncbi:MAG: hypothetical protein ACLPTQ_23555, partial [Terriglobales bacterium]
LIIARRFQRRGKWETETRPGGTPEVLTQIRKSGACPSPILAFAWRSAFQRCDPCPLRLGL